MASNTIKLKLNTASIKLNNGPSPTPTPTTAPTPTIKLRVNSIASYARPPTPAASQPLPTPTPPKPKKTKTGRTPKASAKVLENKKRSKNESDDEGASTIAVAQPPAKKVRVNLKTPKSAVPKTPVTPGARVVMKMKTKMPQRPMGEGYDSEASDKEEDPLIEEQFIIRFDPKIDSQYPKYLQEQITQKKFGDKQENYMKFFSGDGRKAAVAVKGKLFAAVLVDLPCIIEAMKSWDRRGQYKSADICQMLLVHTPVRNETDAKNATIPSNVDRTTHQYPHGITAPMHNVRKRRFRKRLNRLEIESVEKEMDRLLDADAEYDDVRLEVYDPDLEDQSQMADSEEYDEEEDAEGEEDEDPGYFLNRHHEPPQDDELDAAFAAEMEAALVAQAEVIEADTPISNVDAMTQPNGDLIDVNGNGEEEDSGDESAGDDDEDDDDDEEQVDEAEKARLAQLQAVRDDMADLEKQIAEKQQSLGGVVNPILKKRLDDSIRKLKQELQLKKSSLGEDDGAE